MRSIGEWGAQLAPRLAQLGGDTGVYARNLATGEVWQRGADTPVNAASVIKLAVMIEAFRAQAAGELSLSERHALADAERMPSCGTLKAMHAGIELTLLLLGREAGVAAVGVDVAREEGFEQGVAHALIGAKFGIGSHREDLHSAALPCAALRRRRMESLHTARLPPVGVPQMPGAFV